MAIFLKFNGQTITGRIDGLESFTTQLTPPEDNRINEVSVSSELTFYDDGFDIIYNTLISSSSPQNQWINVQVFDDCCGIQLPYGFIIRGDMLTWTEGRCWVQTRLVTLDPDRQIVRTLQGTWIGDDRRGFFTNPQNNADANYQKHPQVLYCDELRPGFLMDIIIITSVVVILLAKVILTAIAPVILGIIGALLGICAFLFALNAVFNTFVNVFNTFVKWINKIIKAYNSVPGLPNFKLFNLSMSNTNLVPPFCQILYTHPTQILQDIADFIKHLIDVIIGCGRKHPSPLVRGYFANAAHIAGASSFSSTILNNPASPYYNLVHYNAPVKRGQYNPPVIISENLPGKTTMCSDFMDSYATMFNAIWWVQSGVLYFERKDYWQNLPAMYNQINNPDYLLEPIEYSENSDRFWAGQAVQYQTDANDLVGNEAWSLYSTQRNYWQLYGYHYSWNDIDKKMIMFAPPRFRNDGIERDILTDWGSIGAVNLILGNQLTNTGTYLLMQHDTCMMPKALIWDDVNSTVNDALIRDYGSSGGRNYIMQVDQGDLITLWGYHVIDDPMVNPYKYYTGKAVIKLDCTMVQTLSLRKTIVVLKGNQQRTAEVTGITVDWSKRMITFDFKTF